MNMNDWKIGTRIAAGFAAVNLIAIALGVFAYSQLGVIDSSAKRITEDSLPGVYYIGQLKASVLQRFSNLQDTLVTSDPTAVASLEAEGLRLQKMIGRIFPPEPNTILPSNAMIQRWLWFVADCIPPDYVLLGRQADFEGI